ncbi:hypothetical protein FOBRF1_015735 [Fusarium oxysporum]
MEALGAAVNILSAIDLSAKVGLLCLEYAKAVKNAQTEIEQLHREAVELEKALTDMQSLLEGADKEKLKSSQRLNGALKDSVMQLQMLEKRLHPSTSRKAMSRIGLRALKWPFEGKEIDLFITNLRKNKDIILLTLQVDQTALLLEVNSSLSSLDQKWVLSRLQIAAGASFDSQAEEHNPTCLPNTRVDLLNQISEWVKDSNSQKLFWLNGMAGTGKSTVARTLAQSFSQSGHLGASFFFKRGESDRDGLSKFVSTICAQLVESRPALALHIKATIDSDPHVFDKTTREQFSKMIVQAFSSTTEDPRNSNPTVIIIDALDECVRQEDVELIIHLFSHLEPSRIKVFLTTRGVPKSSKTYTQSFPWLEGNTNLAQLLQDAMRLTLANLPIIDSHPLQLYSSVLAFAPKNSIIRQLFQHYMLELFSLVPETQDDWDGCLQVLEGHDNWVTCVSFSENSKILASGSNDRTVRLWLVDSGQCLWELHGHERPIVSVTFSQDSKLLASVSEDGDAQLWSVDSGKCIKELNRYDDWVTSVAFSFGSRLIVSTRQDQTIRLWETGNEGSSQAYKGHEGWVGNVVLSPQSGLAASYSDNIVHLWQIANGQLLRDLRGHTDRVTLVSFSRDSTLLASSSYDKTVRVWRVDNGDCVQILRYKATVKALTFFPSSRLLVTAIYSEIQVWDIATGECIQELSGHRDWVTHVAFSPDSKLMASASEDETVRLWQVGDDEKIRNSNSSDGSILAWTVSSNRALIASVSNDHVQLWRTDNGECIQKLKGHDDSILSVTFSPNTRFLASSSYDGTVRLWKVDTGECSQTLEGHVRFATSMAFSADSKRLATSSWEEFIRLWDVNSGIFDCIRRRFDASGMHLRFRDRYIVAKRSQPTYTGNNCQRFTVAS